MLSSIRASASGDTSRRFVPSSKNTKPFGETERMLSTGAAGSEAVRAIHNRASAATPEHTKTSKTKSPQYSPVTDQPSLDTVANPNLFKNG
jgi:hypothetical protein